MKKIDGQTHIKDLMYEFLQEPTREKFRELIKGNTGESNNIDFKQEWINKGALSKLMLALGNSGGGVVVFGIKEQEQKTNIPVGIETLVDKADVDNMIKKYVPALLKYFVLDFTYDASEYEKLIDKKFQAIIVDDTPNAIPFLSLGKTTDIDEHQIYVRRGTKCEKATGIEIEKMLNRRIETQFSSSSVLTLEEHLKELKLLYNSYENVYHPDDCFDDAIDELVTKKKDTITKILIS